MKIAILAVGRAKPGPERTLFDDYRARFDAIGRGLGLGPLDLIEIDAKGRGSESDRLLEKLPDTWPLIALDERGKSMDSAAFSTLICHQRDDGAPGIAFAIGGADGHAPAIRQRATRLLSFGAATWPHMMVRTMLAEQVYRAATIAANHPYHRAG
jgi:23S rRNA (pseudouridine1915-N3)-methyltransferase